MIRGFEMERFIEIEADNEFQFHLVKHGVSDSIFANLTNLGIYNLKRDLVKDYKDQLEDFTYPGTDERNQMITVLKINKNEAIIREGYVLAEFENSIWLSIRFKFNKTHFSENFKSQFLLLLMAGMSFISKCLKKHKD